MDPDEQRHYALDLTTRDRSGRPLPQPSTLAAWEAVLKHGRGPGGWLGYTVKGGPTVSWTAEGVEWYADAAGWVTGTATPLGTMSWAEVAAATWRAEASVGQLALF